MYYERETCPAFFLSSEEKKQTWYVVFRLYVCDWQLRLEFLSPVKFIAIVGHTEFSVPFMLFQCCSFLKPSMVDDDDDEYCYEYPRESRGKNLIQYINRSIEQQQTCTQRDVRFVRH